MGTGSSPRHRLERLLEEANLGLRISQCEKIGGRGDRATKVSNEIEIHGFVPNHRHRRPLNLIAHHREEPLASPPAARTPACQASLVVAPASSRISSVRSLTELRRKYAIASQGGQHPVPEAKGKRNSYLTEVVCRERDSYFVIQRSCK